MYRGKQPLSYRHLYHAGNHGDVLKHVVLSMLVRSFRIAFAASNLMLRHVYAQKCI